MIYVFSINNIRFIFILTNALSQVHIHTENSDVMSVYGEHE